MDTITILELQKERERGWVDAGRRRFMAHIARTEAAGTPAGRKLLAAAHERYVARLTGYFVAAAAAPHALKDRVLPVLYVLGAEHVSAVSLTAVASAVLRQSNDALAGANILRVASVIGRALEHDVRFRAMHEDPEAPRAAVRRMEESIASSPRQRSRRMAAMRQFMSVEWSKQDCECLGMDLIALLAEACPDVFTAPVVAKGRKTVRVLRMCPDVVEALANAQDVAAVSAPKFGLMLVPPRPWEYVEKPNGSTDH